MMNTQTLNHILSFQWSTQPEAFRFIRTLTADFLAACPEASVFAARMQNETGTRFIDWIDHIRINRHDPKSARLEAVGFRSAGSDTLGTVFVNDSGVFPRILLWDEDTEVGIKVESVADFLAANQLQCDVIGSPLAAVRTCRIYEGPAWHARL
jgi:hypothetical protein